MKYPIFAAALVLSAACTTGLAAQDNAADPWADFRKAAAPLEAGPPSRKKKTR